VIVDRDANIVWMNERYAKRFGLKSAEKAIGQPCESVIPGSLLREVVRTGRPILLDMQDTPKEPLVVMRLPIHDDAGAVIGAIGFALFDELRSLSPMLKRYLSMQEELASTRSLLRARQTKYNFAHFIGTSAASLEVKRRARRSASAESPVLLLGETGTGKELLAQAIHSASPRAHKAFVSINSAAIPALLEAEFFGTAPGAFTGADRKAAPASCRSPRAGRCFSTRSATCPCRCKANCCGCCRKRNSNRWAPTTMIHSDVRVIAATSTDLQAAIKRGEFRADLYYRLNVLPIQVPPLRERLEDLPALSEAILEELRSQHELDREALALLAQHAWPGNIRELRNVLERAALLSDDLVFTRRIFARPSAPLARWSAWRWSRSADFRPARQRFDRQLIQRRSMRRCAGGGALGLGRSTLYKKMLALGIAESQ
jgi:transcriptional regulator with PAS, ATPase and Fis domain